MIDWLNSNSGAMNVVLMTILAGITAVYAYLTHRLVLASKELVLESKKLREMIIRPVLVVTAEIHETHINLFNLRVENIGGGAARNIRLRTSREFMCGNNRPLHELGLFKRGIPLLGPGRNIETFLANAIEMYQEPQQEPLEVTAEYEDATGRKIEGTFPVDFAAFENLSRVIGEAPLHTIAKSIEKLQKSIGNLSSGTKKLSVLVYSQDDLDAESSAWNLSRKLRRVSPDGRKGVENLVDQEISRLSAKSVNPPQSGEGK